MLNIPKMVNLAVEDYLRSIPRKIDSLNPINIAAEQWIKFVISKMDERGQDIFFYWLRGYGGHKIFEGDDWTGYMNADSSHKPKVMNALMSHAQELRDNVDQSRGVVEFTLRLKVKGVFVGDVGGGYYTAYALLHGANARAGGFVVNASVFKPAATSPDQQIFYFYNISYEFNDVADPNGQLPDAAASAIAKAAAQGMRVGPPKDFSLTVKWPADYCVKVIVNDNGPNEYAFVPVGYLRTSDLSSWKRPLTQ